MLTISEGSVSTELPANRRPRTRQIPKLSVLCQEHTFLQSFEYKAAVKSAEEASAKGAGTFSPSAKPFEPMSSVLSRRFQYVVFKIDGIKFSELENPPRDRSRGSTSGKSSD